MLITPVETKNFTRMQNAVFLAGPCPREKEDFQNDWRKSAIEFLEAFGFNGDIINPTNPEYDGNLEHQTNWEYEGLHLASQILIWIPRTEKHPALTTNIEFGEWFNKEGVIVGFPEDSIKNDYIEVRLKMAGKTVYHSLEEMCKQVVKNSQRASNVFVMSDTHFTAARTLELSYRPFRTVRDMDLNIISNWNKRVTMNDKVIHLGDFGNPAMMKFLNCRELFLVKGNYEDKDEKTVNALLEDKRVKIIPSGKAVALNGKKYNLCHEPLGNEDWGNDKFWLFGHIHRLQMVKRNGINVGIDGNRFYPMSVSEIEFLRGGVENHFDENVFREFVE